MPSQARAHRPSPGPPAVLRALSATVTRGALDGNTERTWVLVTINEAIKSLMKTYAQYPSRKRQRESGPITLGQHERFRDIREQLQKEASPFRCRPGTKPR